MQIQLKQGEIEAAIKSYVAGLGIHRPVTAMQFISTRKGGSTLAVELTLDDPEAVQTTLGTISSPATPVAIAEEAASADQDEEVPEPVSEPEVVEEEEVAVEEKETPVATAFNKKSVFAS